MATIAPTTTATISDVKKRCYEIQAHFDNLIGKYFEESKAAIRIQESKKAIILEMAQAIEERYILNNESHLVGFTCSYITKQFSMRGAPENDIHYVRAVLPAKYRVQFPLQQSQQPENKTKPLTVEHIDEAIHYREKMKSQMVELTQLNQDLLGHDGNKFLFESLSNFFKTVHRYNIAHNIASLDETDEGGYGDGADFAGVPDRFSEPIRIQKPKLPASERLRFAWNEYIAKIEKVRSKTCDEYPPNAEDPLVDQIIESLKLFEHFWDPFCDDKWRRSYYHWAHIIKLRFDHGKHGASSLSSDKDADGKKRKITREQIGDKTPIAVKYFQDFVEKVPLLFYGCEWYKKFKQPYTSRLSNDLHSKLSEKS